MDDRTDGETTDDFEFADELRTHRKKVEQQIPISEGLPEASSPTNPPRLRGFRPSEPNE
ncbi:hypothetical protein [Lentzea cavernae]|uniref:Uncharacterized protein n=1 Tax=Lentzea cavernae TaxID=2020703 RepID=A0ABQ3MSQ1_9PSEU|nr:hypothetical protein [Lentzea cavernae]GHH56014.1 hypothetical protein GCM10017774_73350 [Lentzea cavernae]